MIICPNCKLKLNPPAKIRPPLHCACGVVIEIPEGYEQTAKVKPPKKPACIHRGAHRGHASCQCGAVYECGLYGGVCTPRKPPDNMTTLVIDGQPVEVIDLEIPFHACEGCEGFALAKARPACSVCGKPSTTICSGHSPFGMCGEPLCETCRCKYHG